MSNGKVKIFRFSQWDRIDDMQKKINQFLDRDDIEVLNVSVGAGTGFSREVYFVLVWYKEKKQK